MVLRAIGRKDAKALVCYDVFLLDLSPGPSVAGTAVIMLLKEGECNRSEEPEYFCWLGKGDT